MVCKRRAGTASAEIDEAAMTSTDTTTVAVTGMTASTACARSRGADQARRCLPRRRRPRLGKVTLHTSGPVEPDAVRAAVEVSNSLRLRRFQARSHDAAARGLDGTTSPVGAGAAS